MNKKIVNDLAGAVGVNRLSSFVSQVGEESDGHGEDCDETCSYDDVVGVQS